MLFYKVDDLKPGMRLGKPIYNKNGVRGKRGHFPNFFKKIT